MRKNLTLSAALISATLISMLVVCFFASACASNVRGKSYAFSEYVLSESLFRYSDLKLLNKSKEEMLLHIGTNIVFNKDGTVESEVLSSVKYEQNGRDVTVSGYKLEVSGSELRYTRSFSGFSFGSIKITAIYKQI